MIFINCFILIELANIGFNFDTNKNWKLAIASKIFAVVSGGFQSIALPFLILLRKYLERRYFEREMTERNVVLWRIPVCLPEIVNGPNDLVQILKIMTCLTISDYGGYPIIKRKLSERDLSRDWNP